MKILLILLLVLYNGCCLKNQCVLGTKITSIGGCNKDGRCGVVYSDGKIDREYFPVIGQECK